MNYNMTTKTILPFEKLMDEIINVVDRLDIKIKPIKFEIRRPDFEGPMSYSSEKYYLFYTYIITRIPDMFCDWKFMNKEQFYIKYNIVLKDYEFMMSRFINKKSIVKLNNDDNEINIDSYNLTDAYNDFNNVGNLIKKLPLNWEQSIEIINKPPLSAKLFYSVRSIILQNNIIEKDDMFNEIRYLIQENIIRKERLNYRNYRFKIILKNYLYYLEINSNKDNDFKYNEDIDNDYKYEEKDNEEKDIIEEISNSNINKNNIDNKDNYISYMDKNKSKL